MEFWSIFENYAKLLILFIRTLARKKWISHFIHFFTSSPQQPIDYIYSAFRSIVHPWNWPTNFNIFTLGNLENDYFHHFYLTNHDFYPPRILKQFNFIPKISQKIAKIAIFEAYFKLSILMKLLDQLYNEVEPRSYIFLVSKTLLYNLEKLDFKKIFLKFPRELHLKVNDTSERTVYRAPSMRFKTIPIHSIIHFRFPCKNGAEMSSDVGQNRFLT